MNWDETMDTYKREGKLAIDTEVKLGNLELDKRDYLADGIKALVGSVNGLTSKAHSQTSAEKEVREHPEYRAHHERINSVKAQMQTAALNASVAKLEMRRSIALGERMDV